MPDQLADFFRCEETADGWDLQIATVVWEGHTPELEWTTFRHWKTAPDPARLQKARTTALANSRYFRTCTRCHELNNAGHMHDKHTCQGCASLHLGVVY
jgi:hypothetical protein